MTEQNKKKKSLLDEDDGEGTAPKTFGIRVNKEYAARFQHNKQREELHRLQSKYPEEAERLALKIAREAAKAAGEVLPDDGEDSSQDEDDVGLGWTGAYTVMEAGLGDEGDIPEEVEAKIFDTLLRIRKQDPSIYQKDVQFFEEVQEEAQEDDALAGKPAAAKKAKPMYLKDMIAKQALEYGPGGNSSDDEDGGEGRQDGKKRHPKAYNPEQEALRKAFLEAAVRKMGELTDVSAEAEGGEGADEMGGVLRLRPKSRGGSADDDDVDGGQDADEAAALKAQKSLKKRTEGAGQFQQLIEAYFGSEAELHPDDKFLKEYIMNKGWVDRDDDYVPSYRDIVGGDGDDEGVAGDEDVDDEADERYLREVDAFEAKYEEPGADRIITHPRNIEGTVRKPDDKRKRQRDAKKQRLEEAAEAAREEVKRLKNLKKQELESKLDKLRSVAGAAAPAAASLDSMLEGDFDPEEWDKNMAAAFDDDYYAVEEDLHDLKDDLDLLGEDMDDSDDNNDDNDGDGTVRFRALQRKIKQVDKLSEEPEGNDHGAAPDPEVVAKQRAELQRLLEDYYKLDYEDVVGGIKTRFRYKEVPASTFGLSVDEILRLDDKTLNQVVGIKRMAPYRDDPKLRPNYKALEMIKGELANSKNRRRQYKKRDLRKGLGDGRQAGQWWHGKGDSGGGDAAGAGPGSSNSKGAADGMPRVGTKPHGKLAVDGSNQQERLAGNGEEAGPGPNSEAAGGADGLRKKCMQTGDPLGRGHTGLDRSAKRVKHKEDTQQLDSKKARLASYAVPTLKKEQRAVELGKRKRENSENTQSGRTDTPSDGLSRAQRKNLKRSQKRAGKRAADAGAGEQ
ncbi:hypothetical protein VOLCADRAFT_102989 [Volvox carteri f. nagariensis]|uniref:Kri1-like C-terminal domain-containing protein n=1 Tax=Volvox carteri f. nagariensis TaxID=3068 RepID=D8TJ79_VOLCA|nr:uncharacterized protein VOLCADRAFT_102989 [Volvox carteri f. nagariensis]EFJ52328.1 hypothetical protein VOLCADRAFT_102989 [Volvox carteri f. nagariensis]|eukprot:XP_002946401.1 hypothetical protein VOLCADRAFT_102989 [Volvox carteri f. nagariensis]